MLLCPQRIGRHQNPAQLSMRPRKDGVVAVAQELDGSLQQGNGRLVVAFQPMESR